jgi:hypothetical protein
MDRIAKEILKLAGEMVASRQPVVRTKADAVKWFKWLKRTGLEFHMDDDPGDIRWSRPVSGEDMELIKKNHDRVWRVFSDQDELWDAYGAVIGLTASTRVAKRDVIYVHDDDKGITVFSENSWEGIPESPQLAADVKKLTREIVNYLYGLTGERYQAYERQDNWRIDTEDMWDTVENEGILETQGPLGWAGDPKFKRILRKYNAIFES